jgi:probable HAF family extracellular repeat protein
MRWTKPVVLAFLVAIGGIAARPSAQVTIRDLGTLPGGSFSEAFAINDRGQVVGRSRTASDSVHAFLWEDGVMIDLGALPGGDYSEAYNINDKGQIVGASFTTGPGCDPAPFTSACTHAFLWEQGTMTPLRPLAGAAYSYAYSINNRGQIAGMSSTTSDETHAVTWTAEGQITDLGTLPGDNFMQANAIDDRGRIVGWSSGETTTTRAFLWEKGAMSELGTLNGSFSMAIDINKHGLIVGTGDDNGTRPPVMWFRGALTALPLLPGAYLGEVGRANDRGIVAGRMVYYPSEIVLPVLWADGRLVELPSLPAPPNYTNWTAAYDVNNRGDVVGVSNGRAVLWMRR